MDERTRYWISTTSLDQVLLGVEGGFTQADDGRDTRLGRLRRGDRMAFYSPRTAVRTGRRLQQLTALGVVVDDEPYRVDVREGFRPWRRRVDYEQVTPVPVAPLLPMLGFVDDEDRWALPLRRGLLEVASGDFGAIAGAMRDAADASGTSGTVIGRRPS